MTDLPRLSICMVTYRRTEQAVRTLQSLLAHLGYPKELRSFYIGDDGSPKEHVDALLKVLEGENMLGYHNERVRLPGHENTYHAGPGWNRTMGIGYQNSDYVLWMEDDWELIRDFDIIPYVILLAERQEVGMVRLSNLAVGNTLKIVSHNGIHYLEYLRGQQYAYSGNPHLRHARFTVACGWFCETCSPGEMELDYDYRFQTTENPPAIWRPADIPGWGIFGHIGAEKTW